MTNNPTPDSFRLAEFVKAEQPFPSFYRVTLSAPNLERYTQGAMHFRLLLPISGRAPVWPWVDETGRTQFPRGDDALHNPVYTFVDIDVATDQFTFDVFIHDGGRITEWVRSARPGDKIGMNGPGGGQIPDADKIVMAGDETALPAIRRILEKASEGTNGTAYIEVGSRDDIQDLRAPDGMKIHWLLRGSDMGAAASLMRDHADIDANDAPFLWCGAEKSEVQKLRMHFREGLGINPDRSYFSGYWRRQKPTS